VCRATARNHPIGPARSNSSTRPNEFDQSHEKTRLLEKGTAHLDGMGDRSSRMSERGAASPPVVDIDLSFGGSGGDGRKNQSPEAHWQLVP
jgi:hypothetical protein